MGQYKIGTSHGDLDWIYNQFGDYKSVIMPDPYNFPIEYAEQVVLGDATVKGMGWLQQEWNWGFMSDAQFETLRGYIGNVNILTRNNAGSFAEYTGVLVFPEKEPERRSGRVLDVTVKIIKLIAV